jgi:hypothetical protein
MHTIRPAAVAGLFYPSAPQQLQREVQALLAAAAPTGSTPAPKALIVPHAGYPYSGPVAAQAYARLPALAGRIRRVVLLGPTHRVAVRGLALPSTQAFATPLGQVTLDAIGMAAISGLPQVCVSDAAHALEHSLEVQLPFLQEALGDFQLLPLAVGDASTAEVAEVLERLWGGAEPLILISSDLSHYLPYAQARQTDAATVQQMLAARPGLDHAQACGATPVNGLLSCAARHGLHAELLDLRNSGDTAGDPSRVVGYAAIAFYDTPPAKSEDARGDTLLKLARDAISRHLGGSGHSHGHAERAWLRQPGATFVTLTQQGQLRGCIGSLEAHRPLLDDVRANAVAAASSDWRFPALQRAELGRTRIEVSLLSAIEELAVASEQQLLERLRPGQDGLLLEFRQARGTFLPQVWEQLPEPADFLAQLKRKAGLPADFWHAEIRLGRYGVSKWQEAGHE